MLASASSLLELHLTINQDGFSAFGFGEWCLITLASVDFLAGHLSHESQARIPINQASEMFTTFNVLFFPPLHPSICNIRDDWR